MTDLLVLGDALEVCASLAPEIRFDLVYLDPPFGVGATMAARAGAGQGRGRRRPDSGPDAYADPAGADVLIEMLGPRLSAIRDRMAPGATLFLHLDYRAVHEVKILCDHAPTSLAMHFKQRDEDGRLYRERVLGGRTYRYYADLGRRLGSVWTDIPAMVANTPLRREATGYPTQKPERLLERIIRAGSRPGAVVADLMCGSGTTLVAAARLGRRFIGADRSPLAFATAKERLEREGVAFSAREITISPGACPSSGEHSA